MILGLFFVKYLKFDDQTGRQIFLFFGIKVWSSNRNLTIIEKEVLIPSHLGSSPSLIGKTLRLIFIKFIKIPNPIFFGCECMITACFFCQLDRELQGIRVISRTCFFDNDLELVHCLTFSWRYRKFVLVRCDV